MATRTVVKRSVVALIALVLLTFCWFTYRYRDPDWWWGPQRLHVLGRDYQRDPGSMTQAAVLAQAPSPLHRVGHLPLGQPLLSADTGKLQPTVIYLHQFFGSYVAYSLSGGP